MSEHTKEPWHTRHLPHDVWAENGRHICDCQLLLVEDARKESEANARRIVACVNACAGIPTNELLERGVPGCLLDQREELTTQRDDYKARALSYEAANMEQGKLLNEVIKERDELLAALGRVLLCDIAEVRTIPESCGAIHAARAAIAKSKP